MSFSWRQAIQAKVARHKAANPADYCPEPRCLWRSHGPCPRHATALGGWGYYPDWFCEACGAAQMGARKWTGRDRCVACGPGDGIVECPATHTEKACSLCKGTGFVEELV